MTLPKEWIELAQREAQETTDIEKFSNQGDYNKALNAAEYDYLQGATAYKQAVENMIDGELSKYSLANLMLTDNAGREVNKLIISCIEKIKEQLQTLKPTSND